MIEVHLLHLFFQFWKHSFASLIAQRRANSRMMSNHILTVIEKYLDSRRAKCYQSSHQKAQNGKIRCGLRERNPFGRAFWPLKHLKRPENVRKVRTKSPKSHQVSWEMFSLFAPRRNKSSQSSHHVIEVFSKFAPGNTSA